MRLFVGYLPAWLVLNGAVAVSFWLVVLATAAYILFRPSLRLRKTLFWLLAAGIAARALLALYFTVGQLVVWSDSELGKLFLPPNQSWSYFISYVGERYWLAAILALVLAGLWYGFLRLVGNRSERYLDVGELELTTLLVFASGWPDALILAPLAGMALVLFSLVRMLVFRRQLTTLGIPFMIAALVTLAYADAIRSLFGA